MGICELVWKYGVDGRFDALCFDSHDGMTIDRFCCSHGEPYVVYKDRDSGKEAQYGIGDFNTAEIKSLLENIFDTHDAIMYEFTCWCMNRDSGMRGYKPDSDRPYMTSLMSFVDGYVKSDSVSVRRQVASHPFAHPHTLAALVSDKDEEVMRMAYEGLKVRLGYEYLSKNEIEAVRDFIKPDRTHDWNFMKTDDNEAFIEGLYIERQMDNDVAHIRNPYVREKIENYFTEKRSSRNHNLSQSSGFVFTNNETLINELDGIAMMNHRNNADCQKMNTVKHIKI